MLPTDVCDAAKAIVTKQTGLPADRILIASTHTHSAPGAMAMCLGTRKDEAYTAQLIPQLAEAIGKAHAALVPAKAGWAQVDAHAFTNCRRWIRRPDKMQNDPFGGLTVRAMMHPGYESPDVVGPSGPTDPQLSVLSVVRADNNAPLAVMANFSMHYFGAAGGFSADYFGELARFLEESVGAGAVGLVSQGTSGDLHWMDYSRAKDPDQTRTKYAKGLADLATKARSSIEHRADLPLAMAEAKLELGRRLPSPERLAWAKPINAARGDAVPKSKEEVYAEQAEWIHANPKTALILQALRLGDLGITALPNEVYGITGLKLKLQSPLPATFNIELANGAEGYIPPPEQHRLGGYTTWPARTAGLEETAEPKIVETVLTLLETVAGTAAPRPRRRRRPLPPRHPDRPTHRLLAAQRSHRPDPARGHRQNDRDLGGRRRPRPSRCAEKRRCHLGRAGKGKSLHHRRHQPRRPRRRRKAPHAPMPDLGKTYSVELWFWNGLPDDARAVTGYLFSRGSRWRQVRARRAPRHRRQSPRRARGTALFLHRQRGRRSDPRQDPDHFPRLASYRARAGGGETHRLARREKRDRSHRKVDPARRREGSLSRRPQRPDVRPRRQTRRGRNLSGRLTEAQVASHFAASERTAPKPRPDSEPRSPEESLKVLHLPEGFEAKIVAAEPLVLDPVAFDWDAKGRLWVVEMADYPLGLDNVDASGGRIRVLEDRDDDGTYDHATLFAEGLNFPNGILTWREGVIVTAAPDILYLEDTDGDGKADQKEVLLTGLTEGNQQLRANGLRWGLDNWVHVAAGGHHGKHGADTIVKSTRAKSEVAVGSRDFCFRPDTGEVEPESGPTQFGRNRDDWGHWFGTQNSHPLWHYVLPDHYLRRNPHLAAPDGRVQLPGGSNPPVFAASPPEKRFHSFQQAGRYTSACGGMIYRDTHLFSGSETMAFVCEPFHNLVQQLSLSPDKSTFSAKRVGGEKAPDFFASEDRWCRPVMVRTGPDGALWIADMYRYMIEHPQWLPEEGKQELLPHYRLGDDMGRIYRIDRKGAAPTKIRDLTANDTAGLVTSLRSPNGWIRDKVQQMILWKGKSPKVIEALKSLAQFEPEPLTRLQALCTLDGFGELDNAQDALLAALRDPHPGLRENALRLAESSDDPDIRTAALALVKDPDAKVGLQLAFTLGEWDSPEAGRALAALLAKDQEAPFLVTAALSSALPHLRILAASATPATRSQLLPMALAAKDREALAILLAPAFNFERTPAPERWKAYREFLTAGKNVESLGREADDRLTNLLGQSGRLFSEAQAALANDTVALSDRLVAASLLTQEGAMRDQTLSRLGDLLSNRLDDAGWPAILETLASSGDSTLPAKLLALWARLSPAQRGAALDTLLNRPSWTRELLAAMETGPLKPADFDAGRRMRLLNHPDKDLKAAAAKRFDTATTPARAEVVARYRPALARQGDPAKGHLVYQKACASCHQRGKEGLAIGPGLETVAAHEPEKILTNILDPNLDIQPGFHAYTATLKDGSQIFGLLVSESGSSLTFKLPDAATRALTRDQITTLQATGVSLMPEGLEAAVTVEEMADLIAFLKQG
jgi:putative membrane-bound dehydrogenase-like protein